MSDAKGALVLLSALPPAKRLLVDRGYDADWFRETLDKKGIAACIPARRGRKNPPSHDRKLYKQRHRIENFFARLKDWRRVATRYDRCGELFFSAICIALSVREIRMHLEELYGIDVSPDLISAVTDAVLEEVAEWQNRPLDACYPLVFFDAIRVKIRDEGFVRNKAIYIALGILPDGTKEILGLWIEQTEGARFWLRVMNELKARGLGDILIAVVDGLKGFPEAINAVFPDAVVQTCIVHLIRHSMNFAGWKDRKQVAQALRAVYRAKDADAAAVALDAFEAGPWGMKYPAIAPAWRRNWDLVIPFFAFPEPVRRIIYTTNAIEALNSKLRRAVRARGHFPNDEAATKLLYLALNRAAQDWKRPPREWTEAKTQFAVMFGERFVSQ